MQLAFLWRTTRFLLPSVSDNRYLHQPAYQFQPLTAQIEKHVLFGIRQVICMRPAADVPLRKKVSRAIGGGTFKAEQMERMKKT